MRSEHRAGAGVKPGEAQGLQASLDESCLVQAAAKELMEQLKIKTSTDLIQYAVKHGLVSL